MNLERIAARIASGRTVDIERITSRIAAVGYLKTDGSSLSSKELKFIKAVAGVMNLSWQRLAARPADSAILLAEMDKGPEAAAEAYRKHKNASRDVSRRVR